MAESRSLCPAGSLPRPGSFMLPVRQGPSVGSTGIGTHPSSVREALVQQTLRGLMRKYGQP